MVTADTCCICNVGDYYSGPPGDLDQEPDEDWVKSRQNEGRAYQEWDEDADVDESGELFPGMKSIIVSSLTLGSEHRGGFNIASVGFW